MNETLELTRRDYYAAVAMQSLILLDKDQKESPNAIADRAFYFADCMISAAKDKGNGKM